MSLDDLENEANAALGAVLGPMRAIIDAAYRLGREHERAVCVAEATQDWPRDVHWPFGSDDPRGSCASRARAAKPGERR